MSLQIRTSGFETRSLYRFFFSKRREVSIFIPAGDETKTFL